MTPQERRAHLDRLTDDLRAEIEVAETAFKPLSDQYNLAATRLSTLRGQLRALEDIWPRFGPHGDPEADLDAALGRK